MSHPYPPREDLIPCSLKVVEIIRSGKIAEQKDVLGNCGWTVQGILQRAILGEPGVDPHGFSMTHGEDDALRSLYTELGGLTEGVSATAIDPATLEFLMLMVKTLLAILAKVIPA